MFKVLANDTRLRLMHALVRAGERCVADLDSELEMAPPDGLQPAAAAR